ncbi:hypothetical protein GCM10027280_11690 [Micromonospora polyrhachis]|uniref:RDD family protein n=1 Tax=Micromonospora polyrhachis TaxID=1282883 RepID=A0A7W7SS10_9ACTN|nr:hypothetical protein [Micromonospora polyrhachis]MBB4959903.1 hypothetical protein [Micromonospora polyrhachis]
MTRLETAREYAGRTLGPGTAKRVEAFRNGTLYVRAGAGAQFLAWLIDVMVFVFGIGVCVVALALVAKAKDLSDDAVTLLALSSFFVVPILYGLCYGNGRALGAVLTGTQLVRFRDGGRVGFKACWAMLVRTALMPLLFIAVMSSAFTTGSAAVPGSAVRICIDRAATRQLYAAGIR